ncbi:peptidylprolyl isomerase [Persephonella sp.]
MFINIGKSKWMKVILFITTFAFVGTAFVALIVYKMSGNIQGIAQVNGRDIPMAEFYYQVNLITNQMESQGIDTAPLKKKIYRDAVRNVIQQELLYQEAEKEGLVATKEEVKHYILDIEAFKENGQFSKEKYLAFLSNIGLTPSFFEEILRKELSIRHLLTIQRAGFYLSQEEIDTFVNKQLSRITGEILVIVPPEYKPSDKEIEEYYKKHTSEFAGKKGKLIVVYQIDIETLGQENAEQKVKQIYKALKENKPVSEEKGVKKLFEEPVYDKKPQLPEKVLQEIPLLGKEKKIALVSDEGHYYLIKFIREVSEPLPLEKVKSQIVSKLKAEKAARLQEELFNKVKEAVKNNKDLKTLQKEFKGQLKKIKGETAQTVSIEYGISQSDLGLLTGKVKGLIGPIKTSSGILVAKIENVQPPEKNRKEEMEKLLKPILLQNKMQTLIQMYIDRLEQDAEIIINRRIIQ